MYLGYTLRCTSCSLPGGIGRANQPPARPCSRQGLPCLSPCGESGGLLPHLFTLTLPKVGRSVFCGTVPRLAPAGCYPVSCPVEPGLSSGDSPCEHLPHWGYDLPLIYLLHLYTLQSSAFYSKTLRVCNNPGLPR